MFRFGERDFGWEERSDVRFVAREIKGKGKKRGGRRCEVEGESVGRSSAPDGDLK